MGPSTLMGRLEDDEQDRKVIGRCAALARAGHLRAATSVLDRPPMPPLTASRLDALVALFPPATIPMVVPAVVAGSITPVVEATALAGLIRRLDCGKAPGPSGMTAAHLRPLLRDPDCMSGLVTLVQDIVDGAVPRAVMDRVSATAAVAAGKPHDEHGVRPLQMPEVLYKAAAMTCMGSIDHTLPALFPTIQLGVGVRGGVEIATHVAQVALEAGGDDVVAMRLDFRNAFNRRARHVIAEALLACPTTAPLWRFFVAAYGVPGHVGVYERGRLVRAFMATDGVRQGCPIAAFLFALSVQYLYEACVARWPAVLAVAIADDLTLVGPATDVLGSFTDLRALCAEHGPDLNLGKCTALWPRSTNHHHYGPFLAEVRQHGLRLRHDNIEMLGATIGLDAARSAACLAAMSQHGHFFRRLRHSDLPAQIAMLLLRRSGVPRLTYLSRITPPSILRAAALLFDAQVLHVAAHKAGLPQPSDANNTEQIITTPLRLGGMGFTQHAASSPAAWWASLALAAQHLRAQRSGPPRSIEEMTDRLMGTSMRKSMIDTYAILTRHGATASRKAHAHAMPAGLGDYWRFYGNADAVVKPHLQRHLTRAIAIARYLHEPTMLAPMRADEMRGDDEYIDDERRNRSTAGDWLLASPTTSSTFLSTRAYHSAVRHRYQLPARPGLPQLCECNEPLQAQHWHWCDRTRSGIIQRHDLVKKALVLQCKRAGLVVQEEPTVTIAGARTRCDLVFYARGTRVYVDVMVCCPWAPSHGRQADGGIVASEKVKITKWRDTCEQLGAAFHPFALSSIGELGEEARQVVALMVSEHAANAAQPDPHLRTTITTAVAVALQAGNGIIDDQGISLPACHPASHVPRHPSSALRPARATPLMITRSPLLVAPMLMQGDSKRSAPSSPPPSHSSPVSLRPRVSPGLSLHSTPSSAHMLQIDQSPARPPSSPPPPSHLQARQLCAWPFIALDSSWVIHVSQKVLRLSKGSFGRRLSSPAARRGHLWDRVLAAHVLIYRNKQFVLREQKVARVP